MTNPKPNPKPKLFSQLVPQLDYTSNIDPPVDNGQDVPKEMDIFYRNESAFIPEGKKFEDLTQREQQIVKSRYRFDPMKPGIYGAITGIGFGLNGCP